MPTLSSSVAGVLQVIDVTGCWAMSSIEFVRSCVHLRCLRMPNCRGVSDLSPLAACSATLEELWMAHSDGVVSLAPLAACTKLRKLDLGGYRSELSSQVADLQVACPQLADPKSVMLEGLVLRLQPNIAGQLQDEAAWDLTNIGIGVDKHDVAASGAIPALVQLLLLVTRGYPAAEALREQVHDHAANAAAAGRCGCHSCFGSAGRPHFRCAGESSPVPGRTCQQCS
jgi:hypothetical protein